MGPTSFHLHASHLVLVHTQEKGMYIGVELLRRYPPPRIKCPIPLAGPHKVHGGSSDLAAGWLGGCLSAESRLSDDGVM